LILQRLAGYPSRRRQRFSPHDVLFAKAGIPHRFEAFSEDFLMWVFFY